MGEQTNLVPEWMEGKKINESLFCREYLQEHQIGRASCRERV